MSASNILRIEIPLIGDEPCSAAAALLRAAAAALEESGEPGVTVGDGYGVLLADRSADGFWSGPVRGEWAIQPRR